MPDKIHFRKSTGGRQFWKIDGRKVCTVINMSSRAMVDYQDNAAYVDGIILDAVEYLPCNESEFVAAYNDAMAILTLQKIV